MVQGSASLQSAPVEQQPAMATCEQAPEEQMSLVQAFESLQSEPLLQQPWSAIVVHVWVVVLHGFEVQASPSSQSPFATQQPGIIAF